MKIKLTYSQVKNALENGFIAPLNTAKKLVEFAKPKFKAGKIRRNAKKQIAWLLANAKTITKKTMTRRMDDCFESAGSALTTAEDVTEWIAERRTGQYTNIWLELDENNEPVKLMLNGSYWEDDYTVAF